jgi:hypothetical protein
MPSPVSPGWTKGARKVAAALLATVAVTGVVVASDHQDTAFVEFNPRYDVNDVYAFPGSSPDRVVLVLGTSSPLTPAGTPAAAFGDRSQILYQLKVDNTGDAREDLVLQVTFSGAPGSQRVQVRGPARPRQVGTANTLLRSEGGLEIEGPVNQVLGSASGMQVFAGPRDDPFFIDLEAFFRILPDRKPEAGPLSTITQGPLTFRPAGSAVDFLRGINDLAIVIELPLKELTNGSQSQRFGVWGTTSRARTGGAS